MDGRVMDGMYVYMCVLVFEGERGGACLCLSVSVSVPVSVFVFVSLSVCLFVCRRCRGGVCVCVCVCRRCGGGVLGGADATQHMRLQLMRF